MSRLLSTFFILLALVVGTVGVASTVYAQDAYGNNDGVFPGVTNGCDPYYGCDPSTIPAAQTPAASTPAAQAANAAGAVAASNGQAAAPKSSLEDGYDSVMMMIMGLFAWLVGAAALTLDYAMFYTVVNMGSYVKNLSAIGVTWQILRDIGNIMLIFGFLAVGITTILNVDWYGSGTKMLPKMLMAAVFLNFSLFITEAIIDTGNLFATQFYTQINGNSALNSPSMPGNWTELSNLGQQQGISSKIMNQLGLQTIYSGNDAKKFKSGTPWYIGFMGILLFIVTAFVLFSLAFVLIARFVVLIFLIILAPVGFAGLAVPQLAARAKSWWDKLFEQTVTAPILLLMLYIALRVITDAKFLTGFGISTSPGGASTGFVEGGDIAGFAGFLLSFIVAMGLLILVVIQSKNLSAFGANAVMNTAKSGLNLVKSGAMGSVRFAGRSALGVGGWTANRTAGRLSHSLSQMTMRSGFGQTQAGRLVATGLAKGGKGFNEAKEKSAKTHEEYKKSVAGALDAAHAPAIADARLRREKASTASEESIKTATVGRDAAVKEAKPLIDEVKRLEDIIKSKGKFDPERIVAERDLVAAKAKADSASTKVSAAEDTLKEASAPLTAAQKEEEVATKALATAKKAAAIAYGESARVALSENPLTWVISGPGGSAAGNKIIQDTLKKMGDTEKAIDMLKKAFEKETKAAEKSAGTSEKLNEAKGDLKEKTEKETEANP